MPTVPVYERKVGIEAVGIPTPQIQPITQAASGVAVSEAQARLGETISGVAGDLAQHLIRMKKEDEQINVLKLDIQAGVEFQELLSKPETGLLNQEFDNASGITERYDAEADAIKAKFLKSAKSDYARKMLDQALTKKIEATRGHIISHEATQRRAVKDAAFKATYADKVKLSSSLQTPKGVYGAATTFAEQMSSLKGLSGDAAKGFQSQFIGDVAKLAVTNSISKGNIRDARQVLDLLSPSMNGEDVKEVAGVVRVGEVDDAAIRVFYSNSQKAANDDGSMNLDIFNKAISVEMKDLTPGETERVKGFFEAKAGDHLTNFHREMANGLHDLENDVINARKEGKKVEEVLPLAGKNMPKGLTPGAYSAELARREMAIRKGYQTATESDPEAEYQIWKAIQDGTLPPDYLEEHIVRSAAKGVLNSSDAESLRKELHFSVAYGKSPAEKDAWEEIEEIASVKFGSNNARKKAMYLRAVRIATKGMKSADKPKVAADLAENRRFKEVWEPYFKERRIEGQIIRESVPKRR